ncbi:MAG: restriction endonuclease [Clostridia bacterium]|nr:restriction endonuclease [Clostridia bacterium]
MARNAKKETVAPTITRAEKKDATKNIIREVLAVKPYKHNELIDETARLYTERFGGEDTDNINDVKGRVGSVLDIMKKESDVAYEGGMYALKARLPVAAEVETMQTEEPKKPVKKTAKKTEKTEKSVEKKTTRAKAKKEEVKADAAKENVSEEKEELAAVKKATKKTVKANKETEKKAKTDKAEPLPAAPLQPIAPVAPVTPENAPEPLPETPEKTEEKPAPKKRGRKTKAETQETKVVETAGKTVESEKEQAAVETFATVENAETVSEVVKGKNTGNGTPMVALKEENAVETAVEKPVETTEENVEKTPVVNNPPAVKEKGEVAKKGVVMDMSFLFGDVKPKTEKTALKAEEKSVAPAVAVTETPTGTPLETPTEQAAIKEETKVAEAVEKSAEERANKQEKPQEKALKTEKRPEQREVKDGKETLKNETVKKVSPMRERLSVKTVRSVQPKVMTADEKLREAFLKKMRTLGGDYFEYYSVYLLERYSMRNGRRLEGLKISGGDHDGGIDGEIELTDGMGFRETIYIQSKNWDPDKGDEKLWVVGETLLQQFIGACVYRQTKEGKQHCRGIFITTSRFTPDAKRLLEDMSDKIVGYDGNDLYETAKECQFGVIYENGNWKLDEKLLSGTKAFFRMY